MAPTKRTSLTWKEKVGILDQLKLLKRGASQRSAAEQLDIIGFGCFSTIQSAFRGWLGPHRFDHAAAYISHFGPVRGLDDVTEFYCICSWKEECSFFFLVKDKKRFDVQPTMTRLFFFGVGQHRHTGLTGRGFPFCRLRSWKMSFDRHWWVLRLSTDRPFGGKSVFKKIKLPILIESVSFTRPSIMFLSSLMNRLFSLFDRMTSSDRHGIRRRIHRWSANGEFRCWIHSFEDWLDALLPHRGIIDTNQLLRSFIAIFTAKDDPVFLVGPVWKVSWPTRPLIGRWAPFFWGHQALTINKTPKPTGILF